MMGIDNLIPYLLRTDAICSRFVNFRGHDLIFRSDTIVYVPIGTCNYVPIRSATNASLRHHTIGVAMHCHDHDRGCSRFEQRLDPMGKAERGVILS